MKELEDFTYDFTNVIKQKWPLHENNYIDKLIKSYLFTHQFSEDIKITVNDILGIFEYFLEDNEDVFENNNKFCFIINNNNIEPVIGFIETVLQILSIKIIKCKKYFFNKKIILLITIKQYENTFNGSRDEELYIQ